MMDKKGDKGPGEALLLLGKSSKDEPEEHEESGGELSEAFMSAAADLRTLARSDEASDEDFALALKTAIHLCMEEGGY
jgi:hypothetical protein